MKKHQIVLTFLVFSMNICAQVLTIEGGSSNQYAKFHKVDTIDKAMAECIYEYSVTDKDLNKTQTYFYILQIGENNSKYLEYASYQRDSVIYRKDINKITIQEANKIFGKYPRISSFPHMVIKNNQTKALNYYDRVFTDYYVYHDTPTFKWELTNETKTVCGYSCKKASTDFRGRHWIAWYATDIPQSDGPWKFSGLPGLILQIEDKNKEHVFTATSIRNSTENIYCQKKDFFSTNRERFNEQLKKYKTNPGSIISGSQLAPKDLSGKEKPMPKRKLFFNPIELE